MNFNFCIFGESEIHRNTRLSSLKWLMLLWLTLRVDPGWGQSSFCGEFPPHQAISSHPDSIYWDRFGNSYDLYPGENLPPAGSTTINVSYFNLIFPSNYTTAEIDVSVEVFEYISDIILQRSITTSCGDPIDAPQINIQFKKEVFSNPAWLGTATDLYYPGNPVNCPNQRFLVYSSIYSKLNGMNLYQKNGRIDGVITISEYHSNTNQFFTDYPSAPTGNKFDLFTVILHEVMHLITFSPQVDRDNSFIVPYDLLIQEVEDGKLVECNGKCYDNHFTEYLGNLTIGEAEYPLDSHADPAHLSGASYLMAGDLPTNVRKFLSSNEIDITCETGLKTSTCDGEFFDIVKSGCLSRSNTEFSGCCKNIFSSCENVIEITNDELMCFVPSNLNNLSILNVSKKYSNHNGIVTFDGSKTTIFNTENEGSILIEITYQAFNSNGICIILNHDVSVQFYLNCECDFNPEDECINLLCHHDFENENNESWVTFGIPFFFENTGFCNNNSADLIEQNNNKYVSLAHPNESVIFEVYGEPLDFCELELSFDAQASTGGIIEIWGSSVKPCDINDRGISRQCGETTVCGDGTVFKSMCLGNITINSSSGFNPYSLPILTSSLENSLKYIFFIQADGSPALDNIVLKVINCALDADFNTEIDPCNELLVVPNSTNAYQSHNWIFGDGNTSTDAFPDVHEYNADNTYLVRHVINDNCGNSLTSTQSIVIDCASHPTSCFNQSDCIKIGTDANSVSNLSDFMQGNNPIIPFTGTSPHRVEYLCFSVEGRLVMDVPHISFSNTHWFMGPGSIIEIPTNNNTGSRYFTDSKFEACDTMWRGIVVNANNNLGSGISLTRTTIEDAWRGVELENNTTLISRNCNYYDNYVGVFVGGNNLKTIHTEISDSQFENKGDMLPAYTGQADWNSRAAFGVHATGMNRMNIVSSGSPNKFINLGTGVWVNNVNLVTSNNMFEDTDIFPSVGIYVGTIPSQVEIINGNSFIDLERSIHLVGNINRSVATIQNNTFLNERTNNPQFLKGIFVERNPKLALTINQNNEFDFVNGTCASIRGGLSSLRLNNNIINISGPNLGPIFVDNIQFKSEINENEFIVNENVEYTNICIRLQNSQKVNLFENELNGTSTSTGASLLSLHGSNKCLVKGNVINYNHAVGFNIWATGSNENGFCCNKAINPAGTSSRSFGFYGENGVSPFRQNDVNSLYLDGNFGTQTSAGNNWLGTGNFARLVNFGGNAPFDNQFTIDQNIAGGLPSSIIPSTIENIWFEEDGTHPTCSNIPDCNITNFTNDTLDPDLTDDGPDPQDTIIVIVDPARPSCEALKDLYERLENIDSTTSPLAYWSVVSLIHKWKVWKGAAWIQSCLDSVVTFNPDITPWYDAEKEKEKLYKVEEDLRQDMAGVMQEIIDLNENLDTIQVDSNLIMPPYVVQWYEQLKDAIDSLTTLNNELQADIQTNANSMLTLVNNLPTPFGFLADRKKVWFVEMRYIIGGLNVISQSQWDEIRVIADKCPLTDGQAVYEAMSLLRLLDEEVEIHEDCAPSVPRTVLKSTPELIKVYPNPGKGLFTFEIPKTIEADQCLILDVNGRTIKQFSLQKNMKTFQVDLTSVQSGVYLYVFKNDNTFVQQGKLIVIE